MPGRPPWSQAGTEGGGQTVAVSNRPEIEYLSHEITATDGPGSSSEVEIYAPQGSVYRVLNMFLNGPIISAATTGNHRFRVYSNQRALVGYSAYTSPIVWRYGSWETADSQQSPKDSVVQSRQMANLVATDSTPIRIQYYNNTDADQTNSRNINLTVREDTY